MKNLDILFNLLCYEGSATNDPSDAVKINNIIQETEVTSISRIQIPVDDGTTDKTITLPDSDSDYLVVLTDQEISIKLNGSTDSLTLTPRAASKKSVVFYYRGSITALSLSNASGKAANIDLVIANK